MEISSENLNKIKGWKYEEYKTLSKISFDGKKIEKPAFILFHFILSLIFTCVYTFVYRYREDWSNNFFYTLLIVFIFPISWTITAWLVFGLDLGEIYQKIYQYFSHRTKDYLRLKELEVYFHPTEKEIEKEAILILSGVEREAIKRLTDNRDINYYLRRKRNRELYLYEIGKVEKNYELNQRTLTIFDKNIEYLKFDLDKRKHFEKLQLDLRYEHKYFTGFLWRLENHFNRASTSNQNTADNSSELKKTNFDYQKTQQPAKNHYFTKRESKVSDNTKPLEIDDEPITSKLKNSQFINKITPDETFGKIIKQNGEVKNSKENKIIELPESSLPKTPQETDQLELDFNNPNITRKNTDDIPTKRNTPRYEPIIKASPDFYQKLASKKIEIGMKGELLIMEHERRKLIEEGENPDVKLRHKSVNDGDGFGYDILSFENGKEIYIEVKTTTGSFWSNLFFTQNEYKKMNEFGEQYYLYRICNLDLKTNKGDLFVFNGEKMINSYFDFNSKLYVLTQK